MSPICFQYGTSLHFNWYTNYITSKWSYLICCNDQLSLSNVMYIDIITSHIIMNHMTQVLCRPCVIPWHNNVFIYKIIKKKVIAVRLRLSAPDC